MHNDFIATRNCMKNWVATWKYILSKWPTQYCLFYDYKRCVSSNLSIISPKISISISNKYTNDWKIGWYTPLKIIKQAILVWSFRQNTFPGCYPVFPAISSGDEVIVTAREYCSKGKTKLSRFGKLWCKFLLLSLCYSCSLVQRLSWVFLSWAQQIDIQSIYSIL